MDIAYYLLKVLICSGILFLYYQLALKNKVFHQWNRFYLLAAVMLSVSLPLLQFTVDHTAQAESKTVDFILFMQSADQSLEQFTIASSPSISSEQWTLLAYTCFCMILLVSFLLSIVKIIKLVKTHSVQVFDDIKFINTNEPDAPFSFLRYIFWNDDIALASETGKQIFHHELIHVREKHTHDKLFMQIILVLFWCNPFFWLMRRELKFIHEFIADKKAIGPHGTEAFAAMIVKAVYPKQYHSITNQFFQTSIKRRLYMLKKIQNPKVAYISRIVALPLIAITIFAFTVRTNNTASNTSADTNTRPLISADINDTIPKHKKQVTAVDVRKDKEKKISELTITYEDGSVETLTEQEATKRGLINNGGYVNKKRSEGKNLPSESQWATASLPQAIFILDGKQVQKADIEKIDPQTIESVNVLKGQPAIDKYGEKGKHGAIEINTKVKNSEGKITIHENGKVIGTGKIESGSGLSEIKGTFDINASEKENKIFVKSEFPPFVDKDEWRRFMERNLMSVVESMATKGAPAGTYVTEVAFIVEKDGSLTDIKVIKHPGYDLDKKVLEIMKNSPKWKPAIQNGRTVRAYHKQPITVQISEQDDETKNFKTEETLADNNPNSELKKLIKAQENDIVQSYTISKQGKGDEIIRLEMTGNEFTIEAKRFIQSVKPGEMFTIQRIVVKRDGVLTKLPAVVHTL